MVRLCGRLGGQRSRSSSRRITRRPIIGSIDNCRHWVDGRASRFTRDLLRGRYNGYADPRTRYCSFLRLKRTKIGLEDFKTVKVIGKGAFGEVSLVRQNHIAEKIDQNAPRVGSAMPKSRHGQDLCHEDPVQERNVQKGSGE